MNIPKAKYIFVYLTPVVVALSLFARDGWTFFSVLVLFGLLPFLELFTKGSTANLAEAEEAVRKSDRFYDWLLYSLVPIQYLLLMVFLLRLQAGGLTTTELVGTTLSYGMACGILGINAAHELGHRATKHEQNMSKILLLSTLYMHFFIEHNRGHHKKVATPEDPASSRYGETIYAFFPRSIGNSWLSAWHIEALKLQKLGKKFWSWENEMLRFQVWQLALLATIALVFGGMVLLLFVAASLVGILLLEAVNYIEHYGLQRQKTEKGYERTLPIHSWNSNHPMGRLVLLELSRHSDHHFLASRKYQVLRHFDESPQMPTGYPGMILLALVPPLWFGVMHRAIAHYRKGKDGMALAS
jgi:alkane 1-monooxygenase